MGGRVERERERPPALVNPGAVHAHSSPTRALPTQVAIVVGGGNYYRGAADVVSSHGVDRATGDYVGERGERRGERRERREREREKTHSSSFTPLLSLSRPQACSPPS